MKTWLTDYYISNEVGRVCKMGGKIEAKTRKDAEAKAEKIGHTVIGEFVGEVDASEFDGFCESLTKARDEEWVKENANRRVKHIAGPYENLVQQCTRCLCILSDNRDIAWVEGQSPPKGWPEGPVIQEGNHWYVSNDPEVTDCKEMKQ